MAGENDNGNKVTLATIQAELKFINEKLDNFAECQKENEKKYVSKTEFEPIKKLAYGLVGLILTGVVGALITLVIKGG